MSVLENDLRDIDARIEDLEMQKIAAISNASYTMEHLERSARWHAGDRYLIVRADGQTVDFKSTYRQKPAAIRYFNHLCKVYHNNVYFFDRKLMILTTPHGDNRDIEFPTPVERDDWTV